MSIPAMRWARRQTACTISSKCVLLVLADYADEHGRCWPSLTTIAADACTDRRTVERILDRLRDAGLLGWSGGGRGRKRQYVLHLAQGVQADHPTTRCGRDPHLAPPSDAGVTPRDAGVTPRDAGVARMNHQDPSGIHHPPRAADDHGLAAVVDLPSARARPTRDRPTVTTLARAIEARIGQPVSDAHARAVVAHYVGSQANVRDPIRYAIRCAEAERDPSRLRPTPVPPRPGDVRGSHPGCCDAEGWRVDAADLPIEPALRCLQHHAPITAAEPPALAVV